MNEPSTASTMLNCSIEDMQRLLLRAQSGDLSSLPDLRTLLDNRRDLWERVGDLADHAELTLLRLIANQDLFFMESVKHKLTELKAELAGPTPTPLEKLLVDRIGVCWLQVHHADLDAANARVKDQGATCVSLYAQKRLDSVHKRYLFAVKQLAVVRKLLKPRPRPALKAPAIPSTALGVTASLGSPPGTQKAPAAIPSSGLTVTTASKRFRGPPAKKRKAPTEIESEENKPLFTVSSDSRTTEKPLLTKEKTT